MQFDKSQIIPQSNKTLRRGQPIEGYLLPMAPEPIPAEIRHGASLTAELTVFDQFDEGHSTNLLLSVDRSAEWSRKPIVAKPRKRLFDRADKKFAGLDAEAEMMVEVDREIY